MKTMTITKLHGGPTITKLQDLYLREGLIITKLQGLFLQFPDYKPMST